MGPVVYILSRKQTVLVTPKRTTGFRAFADIRLLWTVHQCGGFSHFYYWCREPHPLLITRTPSAASPPQQGSGMDRRRACRSTWAASADDETNKDHLRSRAGEFWSWRPSTPVR